MTTLLPTTKEGKNIRAVKFQMMFVPPVGGSVNIARG
jgi:hypothetical protein